MLNDTKIFVQVGATRDGPDPYLECAHRRRFYSILIETPAYLELRKILKRRPFDQEIALDTLADPEQIYSIFKKYHKNIELLLAGFGPYNTSAYAAAELLHVNPCLTNPFYPPNKNDQLEIIKRKTPTVAQPKYFIFDLDEIFDPKKINFSFPVVVKPCNEACGIGVYLVKDIIVLQNVIINIKSLRNYNGNGVDKIIIEEFIDGNEMSLQGVCMNDEMHILGCCKKVIGWEETPQRDVRIFCENGYIAIPVSEITSRMKDFAYQCVKAFNYKNGPFQIDFIKKNDVIYFVAIKFSLSGDAIVDLIKYTTGYDWAELSFLALLHENNGINYTNCVQTEYVGLASLRKANSINKIHSHVQHGISITIQKDAINFSKKVKYKKLLDELAADLESYGSGITKIWVKSKSLNEVLDVIRTSQS